MISGSLIGEVLTAPHAIEDRHGLGFTVRHATSVFSILVTHALAAKARRQVVTGKTVFVQVGGMKGDHLLAEALELVSQDTAAWNTFVADGTVLTWPQGDHGNLNVKVGLSEPEAQADQLILRAPRENHWLGSLQVDHQVQAWGKLHQGQAGLILEAVRVELVQDS